ncbi:MAG: sortase [Candidatus Woykebacteria bacterium]
MNRKKRFWAFILIRTAANSLIILGIIFAFVSFWPFVGAEIRYWLNQARGVDYVIEGERVSAAEREKSALAPLGSQTIEIKPKDKNFGIVIEKIDVNAPVVANVDSGSYTEYINALRVGVAHAQGTAYPGSKNAANNNVFLFAHSAINPIQARQYNSVFYLLRKLEKGDRVITFYKGIRYNYVVFDKKVVEANDVRYLTDISKDPILTLQTCDPPGSSLRRLIVTARLVN